LYQLSTTEEFLGRASPSDPTLSLATSWKFGCRFLNYDVRHFTYARRFVLFTSQIRRPLHHSRIGLAVASRKSLGAELSAWPADFARFMNVEQATDWATCKREVLRTSSAARTKAHSQKK